MVKSYLGIIAAVVFLLLAGACVASAQPSVTWGGYLQFWYLNAQTPPSALANVDSNDVGFRMRRARFTARAEMNETFSIDVLFDMVGTASILNDFKANAKIAPEFIVTVGQFIPPVHMYETSVLSSSKLQFYELSDVAIRMAGLIIKGETAYRDIGLMVGGQYDIVKYGLYYGNGFGRYSNAYPSGQPILNRGFGQGLYGGRVDVTVIKGLSVGGHYSINKQDSLNLSSAKVALDRNAYSFNVWLENCPQLPGLWVDLDYGSGKVNDLSEGKQSGAAGLQPFDYNGYNFAAGYMVTPDVQVLARYDALTQNNTALNAFAATTYKAQNITFGGTYYFWKGKVDMVKLGLNYEIRKEDPTNLHNNIFVLWAQFRM